MGITGIPDLSSLVQQQPDIQQAASQAPQQLAQALQNQQQQLNQPPQQAAQPSPQQQPIQQPQPPQGQSSNPVKRLLQNFIGGMGQSMMHQAGLPTEYEQKQKDFQNQLLLTNAQSMAQLHALQMQNMMRQPIPSEGAQALGLPEGTMMTPSELSGALLKRSTQQLENQTKVDVANIGAGGKIVSAQIGQGMMMPIDEQLRVGLGLPEGTTQLPLKQLKEAIAAKTSQIGYQQGASGPYQVNKLTGATTPLNIGNPRAIYVQSRQYPSLDALNGNAPTWVNPIDIARNPGRYLPAGPATSALNKTNLMEDIRGNIQQTRDALGKLDAEFSPAFKAQLALSLRSTDPRSAIQSLVNSGAVGTLSQPQQEAVIALTNLTENAMAMRSVLGAGQGSEDLRSAIQAVIPGPKTPTREYGIKQLAYFERTIDRLERGVPKVPLSNPTAPTTPQNAPAVRFTEGSDVYNIPADKVERFKAAHPRAVPSGR